MLTKKKFNKYRKDKNGYAIGDKVRLDPVYSGDKEKVFIIRSRLSEIELNRKKENEAYSLLDEEGNPPRKPISIKPDGYEYYHVSYLIKINK